MDKKLARYYVEIQKELKNENDGLTKERLFRYHCQRVTEFQHERFIHLVITLFFAALTIGSYILCVIAFGLNIPNLAPLVAALTIILTVLETCYIGYYYQLENGTQKLYEITELFNKK
jgi:hypothetical protein